MNSNVWDDAILEQLSVDLRLSFPEINGFSHRNLYAIRQWYLFYSAEFEFVPQAVAQYFKSQLPTVEQLENQLNRYDEK